MTKHTTKAKLDKLKKLMFSKHIGCDTETQTLFVIQDCTMQVNGLV